MNVGRRDPVVLGAGALLVTAVGASLAAPWLPLPSPSATDLAQRLLPLAAPGHWLGTDHLGRDVLARLLEGARASLGVSVFGTAVATVVGTGVGLAAGYRGGRLDALLMRGIDVILAFPYVLLALALVAALGPGLRNAALAVALVNVPFFARTVRGATLSLRGQEFVEVARLSGHGDVRIAVREVLPNILPVLVVAVTTTLGWMILETAGLSFLGLGAQPPRSDLGSMLGTGRRFLTTAPHLALVPGVAIFALSVATHALGDAVRDRLDPRRAANGAAQRTGPWAELPRGAATGPPARSNALLEVSGLEIDLPGTGRVVDGVGLTVARGEALALVGESGSGKTLTALSLLGLPPAPGARVHAATLRLGATDLRRLDAEGWRRVRGARIGYVPQDPGASLDPLLRVSAQLVEALRAHAPLGAADARARARTLLARARLPDPDAVLDAYPHELSGGMRQRVVLAIALANDPELLVADEPTTALDVTVQREILALLDAARRERGLLLVTHDLAVVAELCDRVVVLRAGRVVEEGAVEQVLRAPRSAYTRSLIEALPRLEAPSRFVTALPAQDAP